MHQTEPALAKEVRLPSALATEFADLASEQREAAWHQGNLVLRAGPGAGKTRTLVARVGYLLATTSRHRSVAAITFTDAAAAEVSARLRRLGMPGGRRVVSSTIHGFCLRRILIPYARFTDVPLPEEGTVCTDKQAREWWDEAALASGLGELRSNDRTELGKQRKLLAAGADPTRFNAIYRGTIRRYQELLVQYEAIDFDAMPERALEVLRTSPETRRMIAGRFPHVVVDEYQDLGPVLHAIVLELLDAGVQITAVGDADQTMFGFQGADSRYLDHLEEREGFITLPLSVNWRSGSDLIAAGLRVLGTPRSYRAAPGREEPGLITEEHADGDLDVHAALAVAAAQERIRTGTLPEEIALLYPSQGPLLDELKTALDDAQLAYDAEKARKIPPGPMADFISDCTGRRLAGPLPGTAAPLPGARSARTVMNLATAWHQRRIDAGLAIEEDTPRRLARLLAELLDATPRPQATDPVDGFLDELIAALDLGALAQASPDQRDHSAISGCLEAVTGGLTLAELAGGRAPGRIVLTTYHSAKGREFDVVVLPGLVDKHIPYYGWSGPIERELHIQRRNFYVAFTRARHETVLITGTRHTDRWGDSHATRRSRFADDILGPAPRPTGW
ncbi:UvrD-helicase domain-containing protein [Streptomyces sp. IB201691-2A2]|uniref:UvrD-helicase domain-containing protein n=1 Tax=Streptomyces sp. IB201691-2A2 TaxID=2561920 RepID=UPI00163D6929|nr:ATP-dependent helicase [Streptomyces sp. IB201691-2A2]